MAVLGGKALAAVIAGRVFRFSWPEIGVMSGLSGSQAAATLATTLVGAKLGLFDKTTINAVLVVILASLVITPALVSLFGKRVPSAVEDETKLGKTVLVPVWGDSSRSAVRLAGRLTTERRGHRRRGQLRQLGGDPVRAEGPAKPQHAGGGVAGQGRARIPDAVSRLADASRGPARDHPERERDLAGHRVAHAREHRARQRSVSRRWRARRCRSLIAHGDVESFDRILVVVRRDELVRPGRQDVELAAQLGSAVRPGPTGSWSSPPGLDPVRKLFTTAQDAERIESHDPIDWIKNNLQKTDLVFFAGLDAAREALARVPSLAKGRFLVAVAAHETTFHDREERVTDPMVAGRSLKPHPA